MDLRMISPDTVVDYHDPGPVRYVPWHGLRDKHDGRCYTLIPSKSHTTRANASCKIGITNTSLSCYPVQIGTSSLNNTVSLGSKGI